MSERLVSPNRLYSIANPNALARDGVIHPLSLAEPTRSYGVKPENILEVRTTQGEYTGTIVDAQSGDRTCLGSIKLSLPVLEQQVKAGNIVELPLPQEQA